MSDPNRPGQSGWQGSEPTAPATRHYPPYSDPAYAGQAPTYGPGYPAGAAGGQTPPPSAPPATGGEPPPPEPPKSPKWLWALAGAALLLVVGLAIALVIANNSSDNSTAGSSFPATPSTRAGAQVPSAPRSTPKTSPSTAPPTSGTSPTQTTTSSGPSGAAQSVVYNVTGTGRALSIIYVGEDGAMQTELNVPLPWSKEVSVPESKTPIVNVSSLGEEVTCTLAVNGTQVAERSGSVMTTCSADQ